MVIIATVASIAIPSLLKTKQAAEAGSTVGNLRTIHANQSNYYIQNGRYANLSELNDFSNFALGTTVGSTLLRGNYRYFGFPNSPTSLRIGFTILAVRYENNRAVAAFIMREDGVVVNLL